MTLAQRIYAAWVAQNGATGHRQASRGNPSASTNGRPSASRRGMGRSPMVAVRSEHVPPENGRGARIIGKQDDLKTTAGGNNAHQD